MIMNEELSKYQKFYHLALYPKIAKTVDKVFNLGNEYNQKTETFNYWQANSIQR